MKTQTTKTIFAFFAAIQMALTLSACSNGGGSTTPSSSAATYTMLGGACYSNAGQQVATANCANSTGYTMVGNVCLNSQTGQQAPSIAYCQNTGIGTTGIGGVPGIGTTGYGQICVGPYYWNSGYGMQEGMCNAQPDNCRGYTLISATTGQTVQCQ